MTPGPSAPPQAATAPPAAAAAAAPRDRPVEPTLGLSEQELAKGITSYEDGDYRGAARQLQAALNFGLFLPVDQAKAHKYLAFVHCVSSRDRACRDEFRKARAADPKFDLEPAEAGHPLWGPVFRTVKAEPATLPAR